MPKITSPGWQYVSNRVLVGLKNKFEQDHAELLSKKLLELIVAKCAEFLREIELTTSERQLLDSKLKNDTAYLDLFAILLVGSIDVVADNNDEKKAIDDGLAKIFFDAVAPNKRLAPGLSSNQRLEKWHNATVDTVWLLRTKKQIAGLLHIVAARNMPFDQLKNHLRELRIEIDSAAATQLREERGAYGLLQPMKFFGSYAGRAEAPTGNTTSWHATVEEIMQITRRAFIIILKDKFQLENTEKPTFLDDLKLFATQNVGELGCLLEEKFPRRKDENYRVIWRILDDKLVPKPRIQDINGRIDMILSNLCRESGCNYSELNRANDLAAASTASTKTSMFTFSAGDDDDDNNAATSSKAKYE